MTTKRIVLSAIVAGLYTAACYAFAPISFGPIQIRVANLLMPLMFFDLDFCFGLALGCFFGNLASPFGPLDWVVMPLVTLGAAISAYRLRKFWFLGIPVWAVITSFGVAIFPLGIGGHLPFWATVPSILIAQLIVGFVGYGMWRPFQKFWVKK